MNLLIDEVHNEGLAAHGIEEEIYAPQGDLDDVENDLRAKGTHLYVVRCFHTASKYKNWCISNVFHTISHTTIRVIKS